MRGEAGEESNGGEGEWRQCLGNERDVKEGVGEMRKREVHQKWFEGKRGMSRVKRVV